MLIDKLQMLYRLRNRLAFQQICLVNKALWPYDLGNHNMPALVAYIPIESDLQA